MNNLENHQSANISQQAMHTESYYDDRLERFARIITPVPKFLNSERRSSSYDIARAKELISGSIW